MSVNVDDDEAGVEELASLYNDYNQLEEEYHRISEVATLRKALEVIQDLVDRNLTLTASEPDLDFHAWCLTELCNCHELMFDATSDLTYIDKALDAARESFLVASEPSHLSVRPVCAALISGTLAKRYFAKGVGDEQDLQDALAMARAAVASLHKDDLYRNAALSTLAVRSGEFYNVFGDDFYLDEAIQISRELVSEPSSRELVSEPSDLRAINLQRLGIYLSLRAGRYGKMEAAGGEAGMEDLMAAKACFAEALDACPEGHIHHPKVAISLANCLIDIATNTKEAHWLDEANRLVIPLEREATSEECIAELYSIKGKLYDQKYELHSTVSDLTTAVEAAEEGLRRISLSSPRRAQFLSAISLRLATRAEVVMSQEDIDAAVEYANEYLDYARAADTSAMVPGAYTDLGLHLRTKYELFGGVSNLTESIDALRNTTRLLPEDDITRPKCLHNLATTLEYYFACNGEVELLNEAIQLEREAASKLEDSNPDLFMILHGLSGMLSVRNHQTGNSRDLDEAVATSERVAACAVFSTKHRSACLQLLSMVLEHRFMADCNIKDLDRAVDVASEGLSNNLSHQYSLHQLALESTYASVLRRRHHVNKDMHDLDLAMKTQREIVAKVPKSSPSWVSSMYNLGLTLELKCYRVQDRDEQLKALREAHDLVEQCVNETTNDDILTPQLLRCLARWKTYLALFMDDSDKSFVPFPIGWPYGDESEKSFIEMLIVDASQVNQLELAAATFQRAFNIGYDTPRHRLQNGGNAGHYYMVLKEWETASNILSECVNMFRRVSPISLTENDRQLHLRDLSGTSSDACASYLAQGKVEQGIEIFEAGRGVMASIAMRTQDDCVAVKEADASLHARYIRTRQALSQPLHNVVSSSFSRDVVAERTAAMKEFEEIEDQIRAIPGLEKFNKGLSSIEMRALAVYGPLVAFCTAHQRCDALIVTTEGIQALPLPALNMSEIARRVQLVVGPSRLSKVKPTQQALANKKMRTLLSWLWDAVVSPVLEHLGLTEGPANEPKPRLWWVTSGQLGLLPLHAAGKGKRQPAHNVFAHVISSYVPSFEALAFARERQSRLDITSPRIALVTMPQTPGELADLDTDEEAHAIREVFGSMNSSSRSAQFLELRQCSVEEVLQHLESTAADIFHFSCHAEPDPNDPSKTSLLLGSDPTAPSPDRLPVRELRKLYGPSGMRGPPPKLAYLSACCTAQQYDPGLIDENIHLAAVFQLLGFPAVVGTLWEAADRAAIMVARAFYQELCRLDQSACQGTPQFLPGDIVARALHFAASTYRQQKLGRICVAENPLLWANFVHIGA